MAVAGEQNYEDLSDYDLDGDVEEALLLAHNECTFIWANREGWPVGVIMSYIWRHGRFWLTASGQRARIFAVKRDPRVSIVVTSTGSPLPRNKAITYKGRCTVHEGPEAADVTSWFYPEFAAALRGDDPQRQADFIAFLDSPQRVVLEVVPEQRIGYDGAKMGRATAAWLRSGSERDQN